MKMIEKIAEIVNEHRGCGSATFSECNLDAHEVADDLFNFISKNAAHLDAVKHWSDCELHNGPALEIGFCTCLQNHGEHPKWDVGP